MELRARIPFFLCAVVLATWAASGGGEAMANGKTEVHTIAIEGMKFIPAALRIRVGDRVVFKNNDILPHTATAREPKVFDSGLIKAGESWSVQPSTVQTIRYACLYHPTMEGEIVVEQP